jgi:hypothetical protein
MPIAHIPEKPANQFFYNALISKKTGFSVQVSGKPDTLLFAGLGPEHPVGALLNNSRMLYLLKYVY